MDFSLTDPFELDGYLFVDGEFPATQDGLRLLQLAETRMFERGFIVVALDQTSTSLDVGRTLARSAAGLGMLGLTGFGLFSTARRPGRFVVRFGLADLSSYTAT
jgi:hypothetical protein